ncbi:MAG: peptide chain release factor 1 [Candidatus Hatepunaea meridiana]|nr:peptide chain release factor 1 [Candidatus Hatepunaea meridiana]
MNIEKLVSTTKPRLEKIENEMTLPEVLSDARRMAALGREHHRLQKLLDTQDNIERTNNEISDLHEASDDPELAELAAEEIPELEKKLAKLDADIITLLVPDDPEDNRNAVLEIRAGTGGEEAALFGADLYKMYQYYFEKCGWKYKVLNGNFSDLGGIKEILISIDGDNVYGRLKLESGVHRVQRVPTTETSGRIHTSAATVAILPEAEEVDVQINPSDLKIDTYRSSGPGGQHVNKTDSAIRLTHLPTGIVVTCQDEKSQYKNKAQALKVLRSRLFKAALEEEQNKRAAQRRSQIGSGDRSAKIRTYNFPQGRVTDHRIPLTIYRLHEVLTGELDLILTPLAEFFSQEKLKEILDSSFKSSESSL